MVRPVVTIGKVATPKRGVKRNKEKSAEGGRFFRKPPTVLLFRTVTALATTTPRDLVKARAHVAEGLTDDEIAGALSIPIADAYALRERVYAEEERRIVGRRAEETFVDYSLRTGAHIRELDEAIEWLKRTKQGSAVVGAISAKQKLLDRALAVGQEMGFIRKRPETRTLIIAHLDDAALREALARELLDLRTLITSKGETPFLDAEYEELGVFECAPLDPPPRRRSSLRPPRAPRRKGDKDGAGMVRHTAKRAEAPTG